MKKQSKHFDSSLSISTFKNNLVFVATNAIILVTIGCAYEHQFKTKGDDTFTTGNN